MSQGNVASEGCDGSHPGLLCAGCRSVVLRGGMLGMSYCCHQPAFLLLHLQGTAAAGVGGLSSLTSLLSWGAGQSVKHWNEPVWLGPQEEGSVQR